MATEEDLPVVLPPTYTRQKVYRWPSGETVDDAIAAFAQSVSAAPSVSDRVDSLKAELSDRAVMESLRATFGDDGVAAAQLD